MEPLILLGMHRSGTSLMVRLLADLGIHMGTWLSRDAESVHFQRLNRRIYRETRSRWGEVERLLSAMQSEVFVGRHAEEMRRALFQKHSFLDRRPVLEDFFGSELWPKIERGEAFPWGWKDPRTALTFPIWLQVFGQARWLHVLRNGIDVAISLHRRSEKQRLKLRNRLLPTFDYSPATLDFGYSFRLWETYVSFVLEHKDLIAPDRYLEVRYEELLAEPQVQLARVLAFMGHSVEEEALGAAARRIDRSRLDNRTYATSYSQEIPRLAGSPLMQQLAYGYSLAEGTES
jgi:hypothetical protein